MEFNLNITNEQKAEFEKAEQFGGSSVEIRKHPEWHPYLMNGFWNAEKKGNAVDYYNMADYITKHPSKRDVEEGKIGADLNYLIALHSFIDKAKPAGITFIPEIPLEKEGYVNTALAGFILQDYIFTFVEHRKRLYTERMPIGEDDHTGNIECLICEGNTEAMRIYNMLEKAARSEARLVEGTYGTPGIAAWDMQRMNAFSAVLAMDDMNIRGQQIIDAYEYAGGSIEKLLDCILERNFKMVAYLNHKMSERYLNNTDDSVLLLDRHNRVKYPMTKTGGASMAHDGHFNECRDWFINKAYAERLIDTGISPMTVDYASLDITEGVDEQTGFKIIEARGFEKYFERTVKTSFGDEKHVAFFYNKYNGDVVEVSGAREDDIVYAGVTLKIWRNKEDWHHGHHSSSGFEQEIGMGYAEFTHHHGVFHEYGSYRNAPVSEQTGRDKLGFQGIGDFPIPSYIHLFCRDTELYKKIKDKDNLAWLAPNDHYHLEWMINMLLAAHDPEIKEDICPDYKRLKDDPYYYVMKEHGGVGWHHDMTSRAHLFQFAASWMYMPREEREKYYNAVLDIAKERDKVIRAMAEEAGRPVKENDLSYDFVRSLYDVYLRDPRTPADIYALGIPTISDTPFAEFIPWLNTIEGEQ